jgi:hypothetical protein
MKTFLISLCALVALPAAALAQRAIGPTHAAAPTRQHFSAGPVGRFAARDLATWRDGYWWHGWRGGRIGWWWFADGNWYWYASPAYPYPAYVPDYYIAGAYPTAPPGPVWWYCPNPPGYYPYVHDCPTPWRAVAPRR